MNGVPTRCDVAVVGAGPAGLAVAAACAEAGLHTALVDPDPSRSWPQTFGAWADEVPAGNAELFSHGWDDVRVVTDQSKIALDRHYVLFDNVALQRHLSARFRVAGGIAVVGRARGVRLAERRLELVMDEDRTCTVRSVIDASGHRPALLSVPSARPGPVQSAYGVLAQFGEPPAAPGAMTLMDFSTNGLPQPREDERNPSFLYAMDLGEGRWLVEETSLAARPAMEIRPLKKRLQARLASRGAQILSTEHVERVGFPMGVAVPDRRQMIVGFGAAAGMVHPATGYHVAGAMRRAPLVARAIAEAVGEGRTTAEIARAGWAAVWPADLLRQRALHQLGLNTLLSLDVRGIQDFFAIFFSADPEDWHAYVSGGAAVGDTVRAMRRMFVRAPMRLRLAMARGALTSGFETVRAWRQATRFR